MAAPRDGCRAIDLVGQLGLTKARVHERERDVDRDVSLDRSGRLIGQLPLGETREDRLAPDDDHVRHADDRRRGTHHVLEVHSPHE